MESVVVIVAAGLSQRMGDFKPLLTFNKEPTVRYLVNKFLKAGVNQVVIVTGHRFAEIEAVFYGYANIHFVHNPDYASTQMFDSAILGLRKAKELTTRYVLFTPVDVPLLSEKTIQHVMQDPNQIVFPRYLGRQGHPLKLDINLIDTVTKYKGPGGMKGAIDSLDLPITFLNVDDAYTDHDMDTPEEYEELLERFYNMHQ